MPTEAAIEPLHLEVLDIPDPHHLPEAREAAIEVLAGAVLLEVRVTEVQEVAPEVPEVLEAVALEVVPEAREA